MEAQDLEIRFRNHFASISIVGLGYVGLPLAVSFASAGFHVTGIDINEARVRQINLGNVPVEGFDKTHVQQLLARGTFRAETSYVSIANADAAIICVPTPLDDTNDPDLSFVINATDNVAKLAHPNMLVVLESTVYPGTTREIVAPLFERQNFKIGEDIYLCFSPERVDPGRIDWTIITTPKVVGGITPNCLRIGASLYASIVQKTVEVSSVETAEMTKILENSYRAINIAFVNEIMMICDELKLDVWEVVEAAGTKPFGFSKFVPGPGVGGHCIPVDPLYLTWKLKQSGKDCQFISLAHKINSTMPHYWVAKAEEELKSTRKPTNEAQVLVLGVAYKKDCADYRESPSLDIIEILLEKGYCVEYYDPYVPSITIKNNSMHTVTDLECALKAADCIINATDHSNFSQINFDQVDAPIVNCRGSKIITSRLNKEILEPIAVGAHEEI